MNGQQPAPDDAKAKEKVAEEEESVPQQPEPPELNDGGLPFRPSKDHCQFYLRYGYCKYGSGCLYHHPLEAVKSAAAEVPKSCELNSLGMPLRPGKPFCANFLKHNKCPFG